MISKFIKLFTLAVNLGRAGNEYIQTLRSEGWVREALDDNSMHVDDECVEVRFKGSTTIIKAAVCDRTLQLWVENYEKTMFWNVSFCRVLPLLVEWKNGYLPGRQNRTLFRSARMYLQYRDGELSRDKATYLRLVKQRLTERRGTDVRREIEEICEIMYDLLNGFYTPENPLVINYK